MWGLFGTETRRLEIPSPETEVLPGVPWGRFEHFFTPAYWYSQAWLDPNKREATSYRIGATLREEVAACLLGGHGIPAEIGLAAFRAIREHLGPERKSLSHSDLYDVLSKPILVNGRSVRYRFAKQKAYFIAEALNSLRDHEPPGDNPMVFRGFLLQLRGIGPKTASWITRNWLGNSEVAIIDVHLYRAGRLCGLFNSQHSVTRDYFQMEKLFVRFSKALGLSSAALDDLIWRTMKVAGRSARRVETLLIG